MPAWAAALYIHRNTPAKRPEKTNDLIPFGLNERKTMFHLPFSFRVIEYCSADPVSGLFPGASGRTDAEILSEFLKEHICGSVQIMIL